MRNATGENCYVPNMDVLSKMVTSLFEVQGSFVNVRRERMKIFQNLGPRQPSNFTSGAINLPSVCKIVSTTPYFLFRCPIPVVLDGIQ
jgi:hypothetical protein